MTLTLMFRTYCAKSRTPKPTFNYNRALGILTTAENAAVFVYTVYTTLPPWRLWRCCALH